MLLMLSVTSSEIRHINKTVLIIYECALIIYECALIIYECALIRKSRINKNPKRINYFLMCLINASENVH